MYVLNINVKLFILLKSMGFNMKRINLLSTILTIISAIIILMIIYNLTYLCNYPDHFDYWAIFWACISALAVPTSVIGFFLTHQKQQ